MKFEYKMLERVYPVSESELDALGSLGWELVGMVSHEYSKRVDIAISTKISRLIYTFKRELNAALLKLALDKGWYDDNEEHNIHPVQIPKNQMGIAVKELKAKYPAADGKKIADLVKANLCN